MESSSYYPQLDNQEYLKHYDLLLSYKLTSDVITHYFTGYTSDLQQPPKVPTDHKKNHVTYVNRNCAARNGRNDVVKELQKYYTGVLC